MLLSIIYVYIYLSIKLAYYKKGREKVDTVTVVDVLCTSPSPLVSMRAHWLPPPVLELLASGLSLAIRAHYAHMYGRLEIRGNSWPL